MSESVYEVVLFTLKPGIERDHFLDVTTRTNDWLRAQPGFLSQEILEDESGQWIALLRWASIEEAMAAASAIEETDCFAAIMDAIEPDTIRMLHPQRLATFVAR